MAKILVVDDHPTNRALLVTLLHHRGHSAVEAADGLEALELVQAQHPQLVISDILMPTIDGFEFVRRLRADPDVAATPVIFYTAHYHERDARNLARQCGVSQVLIKPSEPQRILAAIDQALGEAPPAAPVEPAFDREHLRLMTDKLSQKVEQLTAANERLRESELRFRELAENIREVFFLTPVDNSQMLYISPAYEDIYGRSRKSLYDDPGSWMQAVHPDDLERVRTDQQDESRGFETTFRIVRPDGEIRWIIARGFPIRDETGGVYRTAGIAEDITERVRLESALRASEAGLRRAQGIARLGHVITLPDGAFESWSESLPNLIGRDPLSMPATTRQWLEEIVHPDDRRTFRDAALAAGRRGARTEVEYRTLRPDGAVIHLSQVMEPLDVPAVNGDWTRWFSTLQDVTAKKHTEEALRESERRLEQRVADRTAELEAANKELEAFGYSISHDLRAPLSHMRGFSSMVLEQHSEAMPEEARDLLRRIGEAGARMEQLVGDLFSLSTVTRGELKRGDLDVTALVRSVFEPLRRTDPDRRAELIVEPGLRARADPGLLRAAFENLLGNAWKFSGKTRNTRIEVGCIRHEAELEFFVRDNGAGFDPARAVKLFMPFQRLHKRSDFEGTGIGLATVHRIIRRHGGRVWAESMPGQGATFRFSLPK
jgi:PAS domain S-box-containing protein